MSGPEEEEPLRLPDPPAPLSDYAEEAEHDSSASADPPAFDEAQTNPGTARARARAGRDPELKSPRSLRWWIIVAAAAFFGAAAGGVLAAWIAHAYLR